MKFVLTEINKFEYKVFRLQDRLLYQGKKALSALPFTHSWRENNCIHTFPKGISDM